MTIILSSYEYRTRANNTILIQKYYEKFTAAAFWRVLIKYESFTMFQTIRRGLLNKPNKEQIKNYLNNN